MGGDVSPEYDKRRRRFDVRLIGEAAHDSRCTFFEESGRISYANPAALG